MSKPCLQGWNSLHTRLESLLIKDMTRSEKSCLVNLYYYFLVLFYKLVISFLIAAKYGPKEFLVSIFLQTIKTIRLSE